MNSTLTHNRNFVIVGARGALGEALTEECRARAGHGLVFALSHRESTPADDPIDGVLRLHADATNPQSLATAARAVAARAAHVHVLVICSGILHGGAQDPAFRPEKALAALRLDTLQRCMTLNAWAPLMVLDAFAPLLRHADGAVAAALSAMVGSIEDNRLGGWYSYRMSKAALNMGLRNVAIEFGRRPRGPIVVAIHPGTTASPLSAPFAGAERARAPAESATAILDVLERLTPADSGCFFNWDGRRLPW